MHKNTQKNNLKFQNFLGVIQTPIPGMGYASLLRTHCHSQVYRAFSLLGQFAPFHSMANSFSGTFAPGPFAP